MSIATRPNMSAQQVREQDEAHSTSLPVNVGNVERWASTIGGSLLIAQGLRSRSIPGAALALLGGGLLFRGVTGHCGAYQAFKIDTSAEPKDGSDGHIHKGRLIKHTTIVERPAQELYEFWREVENSPKFMTNIEKVIRTGEGKSHWVSKGPFGKTFEWDSELINDQPGRLIAWHSLPGADVANAGAVRFEPATGGRGTKVTLEVNYESPAGALGVAIAKLIGQDPDAMTKENLRHFKQLMETGELATIEGQSSGRV